MKTALFYIFFLFFSTSYFSQSLGDIYGNINNVEKKGYLKSQRKLLTLIAETKSIMRGEYSNRMVQEAKKTKYLLNKAYNNTIAYNNIVKNESYYSKMSSKISYLKNYLDNAIDNCNTIRYYGNKIADNYKSKNNRENYFKIQNAYNSLIKNKKNALDKVSEMYSIRNLNVFNKSKKKRELEHKKIIENNNDFNNKDISIKKKKLLELIFIESYMKKGSSLENLISIFESSKSLKTLAKKCSKILGESDEGKRLYNFWKNNTSSKKAIKEVTDALNIKEIK